MQGAIEELPPVANTKIGVRIGFHFGPLVERDGDVFGDSVNLAARLAGLASKGQIMTSRETVEMMSPIMRSSSRRLYSIEVKGKATAVDLYEILWQQNEDQTQLSTNRSLVKQKLTTLRLKYLDQEIVLEGARTSLALGRDKAGDLVIIDRMASRQHGKIERRLDKFVLADHSANGTYVTVEGDAEVVLRRAEFALRGHGWIAFGQPRASATETVEFFCE
jgi:adenylate cyclase